MWRRLNEANFGMDWFIPDPEVEREVRSGDGVVDILLLGAATYRGFERSWVPMLTDPNVPEPMKAVARELTERTKFVFSTTLKNPSWANTRVFEGDAAEVVRQLKAEEGGSILIMGSGSIVRQLAAEDLIDEYVLILTPVVAGEGKPLFQHVKLFSLDLVSSKSFDSGHIVLRYRLKSSAPRIKETPVTREAANPS